jgi:hypothetical protein
MGLYRAAHLNPGVGRELGVVDDLLHFAGERAQVFALGRDIHVDLAEELVVVHLRRRVDHLDVGHVLQHGGAAVVLGVQRDLLEILHGHRVELMSVVLHRCDTDLESELHRK